MFPSFSPHVDSGDWMDGEKHGFGMWEREGDVYAGQYVNDFRHGKGVYRYKQGRLESKDWLVSDI